MFLRKTQRKKDGKTHDYWSVVENKRVAGGRVVQRHVLYLGEINSSQAAAWRKAIEVLDEDAGRSTNDGAVSRGPLRRRSRPTPRWCSFACRRCGCAGRGNGAPAGWPGSCGRSAAGSLLGRAAAAEPQGHALGSGPAGAGRPTG